MPPIALDTGEEAIWRLPRKQEACKEYRQVGNNHGQGGLL